MSLLRAQESVDVVLIGELWEALKEIKKRLMWKVKVSDIENNWNIVNKGVTASLSKQCEKKCYTLFHFPSIILIYV